MVAGDKRRSAKNLEVKTLDYLVNICLGADNTRNSCLVALLYLSGRRVNEVLHLKKKDLVFHNGFLSFNTFNEKCFKSKQQGDYNIKREERYYEKINCSFSITSEAYKALGAFIILHLKTLKDEDYLFGSLRGEGHIHYGQAYNIIRFLCPDIWPHWLRHQRFSGVTELLKDLPTADLIYNLREFTKHHRIDSSLSYVHRMRSVEIRKQI